MTLLEDGCRLARIVHSPRRDDVSCGTILGTHIQGRLGEVIDDPYARVGRLGEVHPDIGRPWWAVGFRDSMQS